MPKLKLKRGGDLVVSKLDFQSGGRGFELARCCCFVLLDKKLYSTLSVFTQVYTCKWVPAIIMLGITLGWTTTSCRIE